MLYATRMFVPDPFIWIEARGRTYAVMSDLEIDRARKAATVDRVLSYAHYQQRLKREGIRQPRFSDVIKCIFRELRIRRVEVPVTFPLGLARKLGGIRISVKPEPFLPEREIKSSSEIARLAEAIRLSEHGMQAAIDVLRSSQVDRTGYLVRRKRKLTAEDVQGAINAAIAGAGGIAAHTIVACGNQGCDPHERGHGPLRANTTIVIDIFPRHTKTGYFGDLTRTVVRGRASEAVRKLYAVVGMAQDFAFKKIRAGVDGKDIHNAIQTLFMNYGYKTGQRNGYMQGFFHGTGHGLGLDLHERPRVSIVSDILKAGHVVTVEPGLYYRGIGAVRLEDVAVVRKNGAHNLTRFPKRLEI